MLLDAGDPVAVRKVGRGAVGSERDLGRALSSSFRLQNNKKYLSCENGFSCVCCVEEGEVLLLLDFPK